MVNRLTLPSLVWRLTCVGAPKAHLLQNLVHPCMCENKHIFFDDDCCETKNLSRCYKVWASDTLIELNLNTCHELDSFSFLSRFHNCFNSRSIYLNDLFVLQCDIWTWPANTVLADRTPPARCWLLWSWCCFGQRMSKPLQRLEWIINWKT